MYLTGEHIAGRLSSAKLNDVIRELGNAIYGDVALEIRVIILEPFALVEQDESMVGQR